MPPRVIWDADNLHHILVEHADRGVSRQEIDEVLLSPDVDRRPARHGRWWMTGRTAAGRLIRVIVLGVREMRPEAAYPLGEERWQRDLER